MSYNLQPVVEAGFLKLYVCMHQTVCGSLPPLLLVSSTCHPASPLSSNCGERERVLSYLLRWPRIDEFQGTGDAGRMTTVVLMGETLHEDFCGRVLHAHRKS